MRRILSLLLVFAMLTSMMPLSVFADGTDEGTAEITETAETAGALEETPETDPEEAEEPDSLPASEAAEEPSAAETDEAVSEPVPEEKEEEALEPVPEEAEEIAPAEEEVAPSEERTPEDIPEDADGVAMEEPEVPEDAVLVKFRLDDADMTVAVFDADTELSVAPESENTYCLVPGSYYYTVFSPEEVLLEKEALLVSPEDCGKVLCIDPLLSFATLESVPLPLAASTMASGTFGQNFRWSLSGGTLTVTGRGIMESMHFRENPAPWTDYREDITEIIVGEGITRIGSFAFVDCRNVISVTLPSTLKSIGICAFNNCSSLTEITLPKGLEEIDSEAFYNCKLLKSVTIPSGVRSIGKQAFGYLYNLDEGGLYSDSDFLIRSNRNFYAKLYAKANGMRYEELGSSAVPLSLGGKVTGTISWKLTEDGMLTISGSGDMPSFSHDPSPWWECHEFICGVRVEEGIRSIGSRAFTDSIYLQEVSLPSTLKSINANAFDYCDSLTEIDLPEGLERIEAHAFYMCNHLPSVTIPSSVTYIGNYAFGYDLEWNSDETESTIVSNPDFLICSDHNFYAKAYAKANGMQYRELGGSEKELSLSGSLTGTIRWDLTESGVLTISGVGRMPDFEEGNRPWANYTSIIRQVVIEEGITHIGNFSFLRMYGLTGLSLPSTLRTIGMAAFFGTALTEVTIPEGVTEIGESAFYLCGSLTDVSLPSSLKYIGFFAFYYCENLSDIHLPEKLVEISEYAFYGCTQLQKAAVPSAVTTIGKYALGFTNDSDNVSNDAPIPVDGFYLEGASGSAAQNYAGEYGIEFRANDVTDGGFCGIIGDNLSWTLYADGRLVITGSGDMADYPREAPWAQWNEDIRTVTCDPGMSSIGEGAFNGCTNLTAVSLPAQLLKIADGAFFGCASLEAIELPAGLTHIGDAAFNGCESLTGLVIPAKVSSIGNAAFHNCTGLTGIKLPAALTQLNPSVFYGCTGLTSVTIPGSVVHIGDAAFSGCTGLTGITIPNGVESIGNAAFYNCSSLRELALPESLTVIASGAFDGTALKEVRYAGSQRMWDAVSIGTGSDPLKSANIICARAELTAEVSPATLQVGETAVISAYNAGDYVSNAVFTVISGAETVRIDDNEVTALKAGTAQILVQVPGLSGSTMVTVRVVSTAYDVHFEAAFDPNGKAVNLQELDISSAGRTWTIALNNSDGMPADLKKFNFTTTDAKVAKLAADKAGNLVITVPAGAVGACTLSAVPRDKAIADSAVSVTVCIRDYAPKLTETKLSMNSYQSYEISTGLLPSCGNKITGVTVTNFKQLAADYDNGVLTLRSVDNYVLNNQTAKLALNVTTDRGVYPLNLTVTVKNTLPKVTVKQLVKPNLFDRSSVGILQVTAADAEIDTMHFYFPGCITWNNGDGTVSVKPDGSAITAKTGSLFVQFKGYEIVYENFAVPFAFQKTKYALAAQPASGTIHAGGSEAYVTFDVYNKTAKDTLDLTGCSVTAPYGFFAEVVDGHVQVTPSAANLNVTKKTVSKLTLQVSNPNWDSFVTLPYSLTVIPASVQPVLKLKTATLTLNRLYAGSLDRTAFTVDMPNVDIDWEQTTFTPAKAEDEGKFCFAFNEDCGMLQVMFSEGSAPASVGSHVFTCQPVSPEGIAFKPVKLTVKVVNAVGSVAAKAGGKLDATIPGSVLTFTLTPKNFSAQCLPMGFDRMNLPADYTDDFDLFDYALVGNTLQVRLKSDVEYNQKTTYKVRLNVEYFDAPWTGNMDSFPVNLSIKVARSAIKLNKPAVKTVYQSAPAAAVFRISLTGPVGAELSKVELGILKTADFNSLLAALGTVSTTISPNGQTAEITVNMRESARLTAGKTYNLPVIVTAAGGASLTVNLPIKVMK